MTAYERASLWSQIAMVATAIRDQARQQNLATVKDRHARLTNLIAEMEQEEQAPIGKASQ